MLCLKIELVIEDDFYFIQTSSQGCTRDAGKANSMDTHPCYTITIN